MSEASPICKFRISKIVGQFPINAALIRHLGFFRLRLRIMFSKSFEEMGIPPGYGFKQLLFSPVANALVLQTCSARDNWRPERLFYRHLAWDRYQIIANPNHFISQESPFLHPSKPLLAYVSTQHQFSLDEEGKECHSGNWHGLHIVNLERGSETQSVSEESITLLLEPSVDGFVKWFRSEIPDCSSKWPCQRTRPRLSTSSRNLMPRKM
jgi:hypothetical protein